ncbi:MAG: IstB-like ATP-binding domain-containing protein [Verrucomicrobiales bacterium]|nr:IstB-like ATP-binding domain-containing protein [Verrucomicrobiales bacterium]
MRPPCPRNRGRSKLDFEERLALLVERQ